MVVSAAAAAAEDSVVVLWAKGSIWNRRKEARKTHVCLPFILSMLPNILRAVRDSCCHCRSFASAMACHFIFRYSHATFSHGTRLQCH
eukprot:3244800-Ditylum_brightwellii.AAC.1